MKKTQRMQLMTLNGKMRRRRKLVQEIRKQTMERG